MPAHGGTAVKRAAIGQVRIVGGRWRNTRLPVPDVPGLRPSSDRVRETLFNWLGAHVSAARVVDLFAGTGALGLEALSRGAATAVLVERDAAAAAQLRQSVQRLDAGAQASVVAGDALAWLRDAPADAFDIAFVDPPFAAGLWPAVLALLAPRMAPGAWLYLESPQDAAPAPGPDWALHREGSTRDVRYALYRRAEAR